MIEAKATVMLDASPALMELLGSAIRALRSAVASACVAEPALIPEPAVEPVQETREPENTDPAEPVREAVERIWAQEIRDASPAPDTQHREVPTEPAPTPEPVQAEPVPAKRRGRPPKKAVQAEQPAPVPEPDPIPEPAPAIEPANDNAEPEPAPAEPVQAEPATVTEPEPAQTAPASDDPMCGMSVVDAVAALVKDIQARGIEMADVNARVRAKAAEIGLTYASAACLIKAIGYQEARKVALGEK